MKLEFHKPQISTCASVGKRKAVDIAKRHIVSTLGHFSVYNKKPDNVCLYQLPSEPCWYVLAPWNDGKDGLMLRSSRMLIISKTTGNVLFDGSAHDEG